MELYGGGETGFLRVSIKIILNEYFLSSEGRSNARVLDLAAGTGLVGETLNKVGFTNIDAIGR